MAAQHRAVSGQRLLQLLILPLVLLPLPPLLPLPLLLLLLPPLLLLLLLPWSRTAACAAVTQRLTLQERDTHQDHQVQKRLHLPELEICGPLDQLQSSRHSELGRMRRQTDLFQEGPARRGGDCSTSNPPRCFWRVQCSHVADQRQRRRNGRADVLVLTYLPSASQEVLATKRPETNIRGHRLSLADPPTGCCIGAVVAGGPLAAT